MVGRHVWRLLQVIQARKDALQARMTVELEKGRLIGEIKWEGKQMELLMK